MRKIKKERYQQSRELDSYACCPRTKRAQPPSPPPLTHHSSQLNSIHPSTNIVPIISTVPLLPSFPLKQTPLHPPGHEQHPNKSLTHRPHSNSPGRSNQTPGFRLTLSRPKIHRALLPLPLSGLYRRLNAMDHFSFPYPRLLWVPGETTLSSNLSLNRENNERERNRAVGLFA